MIGPINPNQPPPQILPYAPFISRIMVSYLDMLKTLNLQSHATEVMKYGPKLFAIDKCIKVTF